MNKRNMLLENIPNLLTISRIFLTFVVVYMIFNNSNIFLIISVYAFAALTDLADGKIARRYKWESDFGAKADMIADRFLWVGTAGAFLITYGLYEKLAWYHGLQLLGIMMREVITLPFAIIGFMSGTALPKVRYVAKVTTFVQGFALPALILSVIYPQLIILSIPLSIVTAGVGFMSALYYMHDIRVKENKSEKDKKK